MNIKLNETGSELEYLKEVCCISSDEIDYLWEQRPIDKQYCKIYGKDVEIPRRHKTYGKKYSFNGSVNEEIEPFNELINKVVMCIKEKYHLNEIEMPNSCLINWYENGEEYIGYHSDDERNLQKGKSIFIVSLGSERIIKFKGKSDCKVTDILLESNSLLVMKGTTQKTHKHSLPKIRSVSKRRISLTLRSVV